MKKKTLFASGLYILLSMLLVACASTLIPAPPPTVTPVAGVGVPVAGDHWQVTIGDVRKETQLTGGYGLNATTYYTESGYAFLVVEATFRNLDPARQPKLSTEEVAIISEDGEIFTADGGGSGGNYCAGCVTVWSIAEGSRGFVFALKEDAIDQVFKLQFQEVPPIPFSVGEEAEYPFTTEVGNERGVLPSVCKAEGLHPLSDAGRLTFQRWEGTGLALATIAPDGSDAIQVCADIAFGDLQLATDGAALLLLGPQQGWPSLYLIEPKGKVYPLVKNGQDIKAQFDPSSRWVLFTTHKLGEAGERLYVFDRETASTNLVKEGDQVTFRFLADERLLVEQISTDDSNPQYYLGSADGSTLESLGISVDILASEQVEVSDDGQHIVYIERDESRDRHLFVADLDGDNTQELAQTEHWGLQGVLSPDGQFILIEIDEGYDTGRRAELRDLTTGENWTIVTGVDRLDFIFSADSQWALVFSTVRDSGMEGEDQHALYVVHTADGSLREIADVTNAFFSPDGAQLAYERQTDDNLEMYVTSLDDEAVKSLGPGVLTGWFPLGTIH